MNTVQLRQMTNYTVKMADVDHRLCIYYIALSLSDDLKLTTFVSKLVFLEIMKFFEKNQNFMWQLLEHAHGERKSKTFIPLASQSMVTIHRALCDLGNNATHAIVFVYMLAPGPDGTRLEQNAQARL